MKINIFLLLKPRMSSSDIIKRENLFDLIELSGKKEWRKKIDGSGMDIENPFSIGYGFKGEAGIEQMRSEYRKCNYKVKQHKLENDNI